MTGVDFGAGVGEEGDAEGDEDGAEEVGALGELAETEYGGETGYALDDDELVGLLDGEGAHEYGEEVDDEGCAAVHEDAYEDGGHAEWEYVGVGEGVVGEGVGEKGKEGEEGEDEEHGAVVVEVVAAELLEVDDEHGEYEYGEGELTDEGDEYVGGGLGLLALVLLHALENAEGGFVDYLTAVDYLLTYDDVAEVGGEAAEELFTLELVLEVVLTEVAFDVAVETVGDELVVGYVGALGAVEDVFVGGLGVVEVADGLYGGGPAADDADVVDVGLADVGEV